MPPRRQRTVPATVPQRTLLSSFSSVTKSAATNKGTKRKLTESEAPILAPRTIIVQDGDEDVVQIVSTKRTPVKASPSPKPSPRVAKRTKLDGFITRSPKQVKDASSTPSIEAIDTPDESLSLPKPLKNLVQIHTALLTTLLLHQAQNQVAGIYASFTTILPHIERLARRKVSLDDLRKVVWISHYNDAISSTNLNEEKPGIKLIDYGHGKVCVKFCEDGKSKLVNSEQLRAKFMKSAGALWGHIEAERSEKTPDESERGVKEMYQEQFDVPLAPLHPHAHTATISKVIRGKSQGIIAELKAKATKPLSAPIQKTKQTTLTSRSSSLLDRIRAKAAAAPTAPTPEELARAAAEQRAPEVCEVLKSFRARAQSMGLRAVVDVIRESARNPIGAKEAELAIRLVAKKEDWCHVRNWKGVEAIVFGGKEIREQFV